MTFYQTLEAIVTLFIQLFVIFPYSALTIRRQRELIPKNKQSIEDTAHSEKKDSERKPGAMISDKVHKLCTSQETVSSLLAKDPTMAPGDAWKQLYGGHAAGEKESKNEARRHRDTITPEDLQRALECGNWGPTQPSELFLKMYHDALCTLDNSVSNCMVSPPLMGSSGVMPLSVISVVPDIMRHMSNLIVRAEKEVILATNYWQNSVASKYITNAMRELSRRAGERGERIVFKLQYDRGSPKQLLDNHYFVPEKEYLGKAVALPAAEDIPNIDLQVMNYHRPMLGTFHCKYMVVDRKFAVLQSNNIQDNDNMEMMTHLEGPIVDSLYDMALISWHKKFEPPLPSHNSPAVQGGLRSFENKGHNEIFDQNGAIRGHSAVLHPERMQTQSAYSYEPRASNQPGYVRPESTVDGNVATGPSTNESVTHPIGNSNSTEDLRNGVRQIQLDGDQNTHHEFEGKDLKTTEMMAENARAIATTGDAEHIVHTKNSEKKEPVLPENGTLAQHGVNGPDMETQEFLSNGIQVIPQSQIEHPSSSMNLLPEHTTDDPHYDEDIAGEVARVQTAVSPKNGETRVEAVTRHLNHTKNPGFKGNAPDCAPQEEMTPYIPHPVHEPFPIAMVCREPYGSPNHSSVYNPQNEVWLSALRNATKNVFIQSPTLNAEPLVPEIINACERGIDVYCYICLGYNDTGELLPMQGGTNEMIAHKMYTTLSDAGKQHLHYFFYVGKDQTTPLVAKKKLRDCHIKVMIVDEHIGIQGNGNQDTQSWFHSQEINVMIDSAMVCRGWIDGLRRNQNTHLYGEVGKSDGIWRDDRGEEAKDVIGVGQDLLSCASLSYPSPAILLANMRTSALLSLLAGVGSVAAAATTKPYGLPKTKLDKKDIHLSVQADGLDVKLDITNSTSSVVKPKVFIISMFSPEADIWYENSFTEGSIGNLLAKNITVPGFSPLFPQAHCLADGSVCQLTTGESEINAASTITALTLSPAFDLSSTYFLVGGIAGINPKHGSIGDVAFSKYTIQVALQYEFDAREKPDNFTTGYFPQGSYAPDQYPGNIYGTEVFEVNEPLRDLAVGFAKKASLNDSSESIAYRALYATDNSTAAVNKYQAATHAPTVITCDTATSDVYYSGTLLGEAFENTTTLLTNGSGVYCMTAQEDNATLSALLRAALFKIVDFSRIIIMRTASDFDRPYPGASVEFNLLYSNQGAFEPAVENIYIAGTEVIKGLLDGWNSTFAAGVAPTNYIGDIFGSLGGEPDFGPGSEFGGEQVDPDNEVIYVKRDGQKKAKSRREMKGKKGLMRRI